MCAETITLIEQTQRGRKNICLTCVCAASVDSINELLDFGSNSNRHWLYCSFISVEIHATRRPGNRRRRNKRYRRTYRLGEGIRPFAKGETVQTGTGKIRESRR